MGEEIKKNGFESLRLEISYRSDKNNIYRDFYEKCLEKSIFYDRAVGYFRSGSLKLISKGLDKLIRNNGKIRIVTSPELQKEDIVVLSEEKIKEKVNYMMLKEWEEYSKEIDEDTLKVFAWLVANEKLELRVAYQNDGKGFYHEKFGIFTDSKNNSIAFSGSVNETQGGMKNNFESIDVYSSIDGDKDCIRVNEKKQDFEKLWNNETEKLDVFKIDEALKRKIVSCAPSHEDIQKIIKDIFIGKGIRKPDDIEIREYQEIAYDKWREAGFRGILEMATGSGKTITALSIMEKVSNLKREKEENICFVIVCPQKYLVGQWEEEVRNFNLKSTVCNSDNDKWMDQLNNQIALFNGGKVSSFCAITTTKSFQNIKFVRSLKRIKKNIMLVVDECHNLGSSGFESFLKKNEVEKIEYRLGLSATVERQNDEEGNLIIKKYLGDIIYTYTMKEAIENGFLTKYKYHPIYVNLTEEEEDEYLELTKKINKLYNSRDDNEKKNIKKVQEMLLFKRARIINLALNKIDKLLKIIEKDEFESIIYVGAGKRSDEEKNIMKIVTKLREEKGIKIEKFTSEESKEERIEIIRKFKAKEINAMVAIKCLDEGVNIPTIKKAYILASTTNNREYVQRRGRILRRSVGKEYAEIVDFIIVPRNNSYSDEVQKYEIERKLLISEFKRLQEYNSLAINKNQNELKILKLKEKYKIGED